MKKLELNFQDSEYAFLINRQKIAVDGGYCKPEETLEQFYQRYIAEDARVLSEYYKRMMLGGDFKSKPKEPEPCCESRCEDTA